MRISVLAGLSATLAAFAPMPAFAQDADRADVSADAPPMETVYDGDYLSIGVGGGYGPSYTGSDDYQFFPVPVVQGSFGGIEVNPRPAGVAVDFIPDRATGTNFSLGVVGKVNLNRTRNIDDRVVEQLGELDTAVEVGPTAGVSFAQVLNPYDSLSINVDAVWDVAGAHDGMSVSPNVTYFTPVSRAAAVALSVSSKFIDDDYADYYYTVTPAQSVVTGGALPAYKADGGFESLGLSLIGGYDLDGDLTNGGLAVFGIASYSRLLGDAKDTPFTSVRGDADQWLFGLGVGYTFGL